MKRDLSLESSVLDPRTLTDAEAESMEVTVEHRRKRALAHVRPTPFFNPERKRA